MPVVKAMHRDEIRVKITRLVNGTYHAHVIDITGNDTEHAIGNQYDKDDKGALLYVCAVIFIYGFSIILMIASLVKKDTKSDKGVSKYVKDIDRLRRLERRQEKFKMRLAMQRKRVRHILGADTAVLGKPQESKLTSLSSEEHTSVCDTRLMSLWANDPPNAAEEDAGQETVEGRIAEVKIDLCGSSDSLKDEGDTSVVSAFILPVPPKSPRSPCFSHDGSIGDSTLHPVFELDEEAVFV